MEEEKGEVNWGPDSFLKRAEVFPSIVSRLRNKAEMKSCVVIGCRVPCWGAKGPSVPPEAHLEELLPRPFPAAIKVFEKCLLYCQVVLVPERMGDPPEPCC